MTATHPKNLDDIDARKRAAGLPNMLDPLFLKYEQIHRLQSGHNIHEASTKFEIGELVVEVMADSDTYGQRAVGALEAALGIKKTALHEYAHVARTWTPDDFAELMEKTDCRGVPLQFYHLTEIRRVTDSLEREKWVNLTIEHGWSVRELRTAMIEDVEPATTADPDEDVDDDLPDNVEPVDSPVTLRSALSEMRGVVWQIRGGMAAWQMRIFSPLGDNPAQFGDWVLDSLGQTREVCVNSQQALHDLIEQLDVAILTAREAAAVIEGGDDDGR